MRNLDQDDHVHEWPGSSVIRVALLLPKAGWGATMLFSFLILLQSLLPIGFMLSTALLIGELPTLVSGTNTNLSRTATFSLIALATLYAVQQILGPARQAVEEIVGERLQDVLRSQLLATLLAPCGIAHLERPEIAD